MLGGMEQKNMRVVVYARVSSEDQAERGTIESQIEFARKYCDLHEIDVLDWYLDDGITGTLPLDDRPDGKRLREDAHAGKFDLVLIYKLDRLGRSARIIINSVYDLEQHGVKIRSMTEPFDTSTPAGRFTLNVLASVADLERETVLERMWHGANRAARAGRWLGGIVPYGYYVDDEQHLQISDEPLPGFALSEADVVRLIYQMSAGRELSCIAIADYLNAIGVPPSYTKDGRKVKRGKRKANTAGIWRPARIRNMIISTTYKGVHGYGKRSSKDREIIKREVPAIVDEDTWARAQQVLRNNFLGAKRNTKQNYLLRGLIKCGECGLNYNGYKYPLASGDTAIGYRCNGKSKYGVSKHKRCQAQNVPGEWLEELIWQDCVRFIEHPGEAISELEKSMSERQERKADIAEELGVVKRAMLDKDDEKQAVLDLFRRKIISSADVEAQISKIAQELQSIEQVAASLEKDMRAEVDLIDRFASAEELLADLRAKLTDNPDWETKREIVHTLVRQITIYTDNSSSRPQTRIEAHFMFVSVVNHTDKRVDNNTQDIKRARVIKREAAAADSAGARLHAARQSAGLGVNELAALAGTYPQGIIDVELGRKQLTFDRCRRLATYLGVSFVHLGAYDTMPERTLAERIKKARYYHGLFIREAAQLLGVQWTTFKDWENGRLPQAHNMDNLAPFLEILN